MERREFVLLPEQHDLLRELQFYEAVVAKSGHLRHGAPDGSKVHDDLVTAVALGVRGAGSAVHRASFVEAGLPPFITSSTPLYLGAVVSTTGDVPDDCGRWVVSGCRVGPEANGASRNSARAFWGEEGRSATHG